MNGIIYKSTNLINGKSYIGKSIKSLNHRKSKHINHTKNGSTNYFHKAIRKYGIENFEWFVIEECKEDILNEREIFWIKKLKTRFNGYNLTDGGDGQHGYICSDETKNKLRLSNTGKHHSEETKNKIREYRKNLPIEVRKKLSISQTGHLLSETSKLKIKNFNLGKKHSEETKEKMRKPKIKKKIVYKTNKI